MKTHLIIFSLVFSTFCYSTQPGAFSNYEKIILVHTSNVLSENSEKIAGSQFKTNDSSAWHTDNENIRTRITLHHTMGGLVEKSKHGLVESGVMHESHLHKDSNISAYLDPLSEFVGEIFGGKPGDFMSIDRHFYGKKSTIIVPIELRDEFQEKNPTYQGNLVIYDPSIRHISEVTREVVENFYNSPIFQELDSIDNISGFVRLCEKNNFIIETHSETHFALLETLLANIRSTIFLAKKNAYKTPILFADEVLPLACAVDSLTGLIKDDLDLRLGTDKKLAIATWAKDISDWLNLIKVDAFLRAEHRQSIFQNNPNFMQFISARYSYEKVKEMGLSLSHQEELSDLKLCAPGFFNQPIFNTLVKAKIDHLNIIGDNLNKHGFTNYYQSILMIRLLTNSAKTTTQEELLELVKETENTTKLTYHLEILLDSLLLDDQSFMNKESLENLNSDVGRLIRQKYFQDRGDQDFFTLVSKTKGLEVLFADLNTIECSQKWTNYQKKFAYFIRQRLLDKAVASSLNLPSCNAIAKYREKGSIKDDLKDPYCSTFNISYLDSMATKIFLYLAWLKKPLSRDNPIATFIEQGLIFRETFFDWSDWSELSAQDMVEIQNKFLQRPDFSLNDLLETIAFKISERKNHKEIFWAYFPAYAETAQKIMDADKMEISFTLHQDMDYYLHFLKQCALGITNEVGNNKLFIEPNIPGAINLAEKLRAFANEEDQIKIAAILAQIPGLQ